ncbi:6,7-dimethyl-8-ribityllumazine synthase [Porphyromonas sp.]|uniref:6,7-dimethyl-8-ribityllumazine synthase n=1 Tax=Porphyromonas sp. TaxID=1924944 RepID=UPI0026DCA8F4|nr:6,7-dimethyl-8-ribityllumazine synthase [Porphyromonas sp.]MDO4695402.1 6,7-dimethyl-8-ribityllumazine synthase [Porphyromonas sp.]MDO4770550.1 6,7-dimethyl-8-ribityllumazine synthase [Porphyromonas sp.]
MATVYKNLSDHEPSTIPSGKGHKFSVVVSEWNSDVTYAMADAAVRQLTESGVQKEDISIHYVAGSFELIYACTHIAKRKTPPSAVIAIGCIVRGETPHFEYISEAVAVNIGKLNVDHNTPVILGVLTTDTMQQALDRAGGKHGNKGDEAAVTALKLVKEFAL